MDKLLVICRKLTKQESKMSYIEHCVQSSENLFEMKQIILLYLPTQITFPIVACRGSKLANSLGRTNPLTP